MIVDDHAVIRAGLRMLIEQDSEMTVVAMAGNRNETLKLAQEERPDIIVFDILLGEEDGLMFLPELCKLSPNSRVLVLTGIQTEDAHRQAIRRGAVGIVLKQQAADQLLKAIRKVHAGEVWIDRSMMGAVLDDARSDKLQNSSNPQTHKIAGLTPREREVITLVAQGLKNKQIAGKLFISETTVTHHLSSIYSKLDVSDRLELVIYAFANKLAKQPDA